MLSGDRHAHVPVRSQLEDWQCPRLLSSLKTFYGILFLGHPVCICIVLWIMPKYVDVLFVVEDIVHLTAWIELGRQSIGTHSATIRLPSSCSSTTMLQTHHHLQYNKIYLVWNLDCDLWCFLILRSADLGQTVHAAGANVQWLCNLLMVPPNIVFLVFLYCIVVLLMVPPNMDPHTKLPLLLGSSD